MKYVRLIGWIGSFSLVACSAMKNMDEMKSKTGEMHETMKGMAADVETTKDTSGEMKTTMDGMAQNVAKTEKTSDDMKQTMTKMNQTTLEMKQMTGAMGKSVAETLVTARNTYNDLRAKDSADARKEFLKSMKAAGTQESKISWAAKYMQSFEFQLWKNSGADTPHSLEVLKNQAVSEFMREVSELIKPEYLQPGKEYLGAIHPDPEYNNLFALSVALHFKNHNQEVVAENTGASTTSMLQLILDGLGAKKEIEGGNKNPRSLPEYVQQVLVYESSAVYLLQVRHNSLAQMALAKLANIDPRSAGVNNTRVMADRLLTAWPLKIEDKNTVQLQEYTRYLNEAIQTRRQLTTLGVSPLTYSKVAAIYKNMDTNPAKPYLTQGSDIRRQAVSKLLGAIEAYRTQFPAPSYKDLVTK